MPHKSTWLPAIFILANCYFTHLTALDLSTLTSLGSPKILTCYKCSTLTSPLCQNITEAEKKEECRPDAKGCVKQEVENYNGIKATFRECYYASVSTFLLTNLACENLTRTSSYDKAICYKCSGNLCNNSHRSYSVLSVWLNLLVLFIVAFILRM